MAVQADVAKKERDAQRLREKMRDMGLHKYDELVHTFQCLTEHLSIFSLLALGNIQNYSKSRRR